jgi:hypothetical protein
MKRLRDTAPGDAGAGDDPLFERGVDLLRRTPSAPPATDVVKTRVWRSVQRAPAAPARHGLRALVVKLAVVGVVALVAGTAGAVLAQRYIVPRLDRAGGTGDAAPPGPAKAAAARPEKAAPAALIIEAQADDDDSAPAEIPVAKAPPRSAPRRPATPAPSAAAVARERTEVLDALIALRREHDPVRAGTLLARYLAAHPRGALREEALVLAIEAADARADRTAGADLARTYLAEFPAGRFLPFARSHTVPPRAAAAAPRP